MPYLADFFRRSSRKKERMFRSADEAYTKMLDGSIYSRDRAGRLNVMRGWFLDNTDVFVEWARSRGFRPEEIQRALHASRRVTHASLRLTYQQRKRLRRMRRPGMWALPEREQLPLVDKHGRLDPKHIANAAARLSMMRNRGSVTPDEFRAAKRRIIAAACKKGVERTCRAKLAA